MNRPEKKQMLLWTVLLTVVFELLLVVFRFALGMEATRDTASTIGAMTFGVRVHHGYVGVLLLLAAAVLRRRAPACSRWLIVVGAALVASDLIHHFLVLWPLLGDPHFDLFYG